MTLTNRIITFVRKHPGRTAWGISKELRASASSVSSILNRQAKVGRLRRQKGFSGSWTYTSSIAFRLREAAERLRRSHNT